MKSTVFSFVVASLVFCLPRTGRADTPFDRGIMAKNAVYLEGLGPGGLYSLNYERIIANAFAPRIGFSVLAATISSGSESQTATSFSIPITVSYVGLHSGIHGFEAGGGTTIFLSTGSTTTAGVTSSGSSTAIGITGFAGYRLHPVARPGFQFRVGLGLQGIFSGSSAAVFPWPYLSVGGAF